MMLTFYAHIYVFDADELRTAQRAKYKLLTENAFFIILCLLII
jgi:aromatic ring-cleaving dioxygenase